MNGNDIIALGLGLQSPWEIVGQTLNTEKHPHELHLTIQAKRGTQYPCPECGTLSYTHDFKEMTWRHLNFFQHHCYITAKVPRVRCLEHGVKQVLVPWARKGSHFTLLFEQAAMLFVREMPVLTTARLMEIDDKKLWRILEHYVRHGIEHLDLKELSAISLDETQSRKGHRYVSVFLDCDAPEKPVVFAIPGKGKEVLAAFKKHLIAHGGHAENIVEVVSDMSSAFIAGVKLHFTNSNHTVDWFHVVQLFNKALDSVRRAEAKQVAMPKATRFATLKKADGTFTEKQIDALNELVEMNLETSKAWRIKEMLRWVRQAETQQAARWRLTNFLNEASRIADGIPLLQPICKALKTVGKHREAILARWVSEHSNARIEAFNGLFQAAKRRARGYRNDATFVSIIYLLAAPIQNLLQIHTK